MHEGTRKQHETQNKVCLLRQSTYNIRGCIQKFPDWPTGARAVNGTDLCHKV